MILPINLSVQKQQHNYHAMKKIYSWLLIINFVQVPHEGHSLPTSGPHPDPTPHKLPNNNKDPSTPPPPWRWTPPWVLQTWHPKVGLLLRIAILALVKSYGCGWPGAKNCKLVPPPPKLASFPRIVNMAQAICPGGGGTQTMQLKRKNP